MGVVSALALARAAFALMAASWVALVVLALRALLRDVPWQAWQAFLFVGFVASALLFCLLLAHDRSSR